MRGHVRAQLQPRRAKLSVTPLASEPLPCTHSVSWNVTGTSALVGVLVPLPFIARVQGTACDRLADQLGAFLKGDDIPAPKAGKSSGS